ncbi:MAG TPA: HAD family hydrolase [Candidatus Saccharimonadales bacterium]|nr:HAD family hydrolase [Candidatus Saccharimonadales bacterium]
MNKAVFIDKDGTLIEDVPYNVRPELIRLLPGVGDGLRLLQADGYQLIIVSNQAGAAYGFFAETDLVVVVRRIQQLVARLGARLDDFYFCPHHPEGTVPTLATVCTCRKPSPGLIKRAAKQHQLDLTKCWMIGDILNDVEAGRRAGCRTVMVDNGNETEWHYGSLRQPDYQVNNFWQAAQLITGKADPLMKPQRTSHAV